MENSGKLKTVRRVLISLIIITAVILCISRLNIETPDEHRKISKKGNISASIRISCESILDKEIKDKEHYNESGIILDSTEYLMADGDTAFDVLKTAVRDKDIQMEYTGGKKPYVEGINYLYEFDYGRLSGWIYKVNDEFQGIGCGSYKIKDGDRIEFLYTCDLGRDVGNEFKE